ncbi:MAG TPA: hypothetical protein VK774_00275 [Solirubrobacteraceae bacterium]|jgi:hypothetical protein|nr:hypothetical protein [Solirubrobacteraceae bacterium]
MKRIYLATLASLTLLLAVPGLATATLTEVGVIPPTTPETTPSCPASPCLAVSRTTGFQVKVATNTTLTNIPKAGSIVAWTINLGKPNATQIKFFNANEGGAAEAGIAILAPQKKPNLTYKLIASSPTVKLEKYFGKTAQFPLERSIQVKKGYIVALTVPTWAPALALGFGKDTSWRASREKKQCASTSSQSTQTSIGSEVQYFCLYQTARLTYSATLVSTP